MSKTPYKYLPVLSPAYRALRRIVRMARNAGTGVDCLCCKRSFSGWVGRPTVRQCPNCNAATRQKVLVHYLEKHMETASGPFQTLYFAPDPGPLAWFRKQPSFNVTTTDLSAPGVDVHWDITAIPQQDQSYDVIACSHVLEHVPEDLKAMSELCRLLKPGGVLFLQVPFARAKAETDEDPTITDPEERIRRFGQFDHVRRYGRDLLDRLASSGFQVETIRVEEVFSADEMKRFGLWNDILFLCRPA